MKRTFTLIVAGLLSTLLLSSAHAVRDPGPRVGINVGGLHQLNAAMPFTDLFKNSRGWYTSCEFNWQANRAIDPGCSRKNSFNTKEQSRLNLDANGWVRSLPSRNAPVIYTSIISGLNLPEDFPLGQHVLVYAGEGDIQVLGDITITNQRPGRIAFNLNSPKRGIKVKITRTNPRNYIRDISLVQARFERTFRQQPYNPDYIARLRPFQSIRFMPWTNPRATNAVHWNQMPTKRTVNYTGDNGVAVEDMIGIANAANAAPWFNIPHTASDQLIRQYAHLAKGRVRNNRIFVELGNEMWNVIFPGTTYAAKQGLKLWPNAYARKPAYERRVKIASNWYGMRSAQMCRIWKQVFANQKARVTCVIASQSNVDWVGKEALDCPLVPGEACGSQVDAYAVGPYFGHYIARLENRAYANNWANRPDGMNLLFQELERGGVLPKGPKGGAIEHFARTELQTSMRLADNYGLPLLAYEAGQHLIRFDNPHKITDPKLLSFFRDAANHPRMRGAYQRYLRAWEQNGGKTLMHFYGIGKPSPEDFFGVLPNSRTTTSTRYQALLDHMRRRYPVTRPHGRKLTPMQIAERRGRVQEQLRKEQLKKHPSGRPMAPRKTN